jgi:hypothetical protein
VSTWAAADPPLLGYLIQVHTVCQIPWCHLIHFARAVAQRDEEDAAEIRLKAHGLLHKGCHEDHHHPGCSGA